MTGILREGERGKVYILKKKKKINVLVRIVSESNKVSQACGNKFLLPIRNIKELTVLSRSKKY